MGRACCCAGLALVLLTACTDGGSDDATAECPGPDVEVFLKVEATPAQQAGVRDALRRSSQVRRFVFRSKDDAYGEFRKLFADQPELTGSTDADALPNSFRVDLEDGARRTRVASELQKLPGVDLAMPVQIPSRAERDKLRDQLKRRPLPANPDAEVFMNTRATEAETAAVRDAIRQAPHVRTVKFLSRGDSYREFQRLFADQPDLIATTSPDQLPESFRVDFESGFHGGRFVREIGGIPGVDEVKVATNRAAFQLELTRMLERETCD